MYGENTYICICVYPIYDSFQNEEDIEVYLAQLEDRLLLEDRLDT